MLLLLLLHGLWCCQCFGEGRGKQQTYILVLPVVCLHSCTKSSSLRRASASAQHMEIISFATAHCVRPVKERQRDCVCVSVCVSVCLSVCLCVCLCVCPVKTAHPPVTFSFSVNTFWKVLIQAVVIGYFLSSYGLSIIFLNNLKFFTV